MSAAACPAALGTRPRVLLMDEPTSALDHEAALVIERPHGAWPMTAA